MPSIIPDTTFIPDLPSNCSPLQDYRSKAKFDWKILRIYFEGEDGLRAKYMVWKRLENEPLFQRQTSTPSTDEQKKLAAVRMKRVIELGIFPDYVKNFSYQKRVNQLKLEAESKFTFSYLSAEVYDESKRSVSCDLSEFVGENGARHRAVLQRLAGAGMRTASCDLRCSDERRCKICVFRSLKMIKN